MEGSLRRIMTGTRDPYILKELAAKSGLHIITNDGTSINATQQKILRAAIRTSIETELPIQCHTIGGDNALHAGEIMKQAGFDRERFIWVHAQTGKDLALLSQDTGWYFDLTTTC